MCCPAQLRLSASSAPCGSNSFPFACFACFAGSPSRVHSAAGAGADSGAVPMEVCRAPCASSSLCIRWTLSAIHSPKTRADIFWANPRRASASAGLRLRIRPMVRCPLNSSVAGEALKRWTAVSTACCKRANVPPRSCTPIQTTRGRRRSGKKPTRSARSWRRGNGWQALCRALSRLGTRGSSTSPRKRSVKCSWSGLVLLRLLQGNPHRFGHREGNKKAQLACRFVRHRITLWSTVIIPQIQTFAAKGIS